MPHGKPPYCFLLSLFFPRNRISSYTYLFYGHSSIHIPELVPLLQFGIMSSAILGLQNYSHLKTSCPSPSPTLQDRWGPCKVTAQPNLPPRCYLRRQGTGSLELDGFSSHRMRVCVILTYLQIINLRVKTPCPSAWTEIESELGKKVIAVEN